MDHALIDFKRDENILTINEINISGKSADITGSGTIDLKTGILDINLEISVLKNLSSIVNAMPIVNYILLGEDGKMYTNVKVEGTLKDPKMKTNVISDTVLSPLGIIKRTIETPFRIFQ